MTLPAVDSDPVAARLLLIRPHLDERAWRLLLGAEAKVRGRGGIKLVAAAGGVHPDTVAQGVRELDYDEPISGRLRRPGAGRPAMAVTDPDLVARAGCVGGSSCGAGRFASGPRAVGRLGVRGSRGGAQPEGRSAASKNASSRCIARR